MTIKDMGQRALLRYVRSITHPATSRFVIADRIKLGGMVGSFPVISINETFLTHFNGHIEESVPAGEIHYWELMKHSKDPPIVEALGGPELAQTHLARLVQEIELGADGPGHFSSELWGGTPNIHYKVSPVDGKLYVVYWYQKNRKMDKKGREVGGGELGFGAHPIPVDLPAWWSGFPVCGGQRPSLT